MALDVLRLYMSLLSEFFLFSDMAVATPPSDVTDTTPPLLPKDSNALATVHHLMKILGEIQDSVNDINGMEISSEASSSLKGLLESARWKFEDVLTQAWLRGETSMHVRVPHATQLEPDRRQRLLLSGELGRFNSRSTYYYLPF